MKKYFLNGMEVYDNSGFKDSEGISYPAGWLSMMPEETLEDYGIVVQEIIFETPTPEPVVIKEVTMRQARLALLNAGLLDSVATFIDSLPSPHNAIAKIEWEYAQTVFRNQGLVVNLAGALGLTEAQVDALFLEASTL